MELIGKIIEVLQPQTGEGKNGPWTKQECVIDLGGAYPKKVCFEMWNDSIIDLNIGEEVTAHIDVESREYNGRWYTNVKAWKVDYQQQQQQPQEKAPYIDITPEGGTDLPF